MQLLVAEFCSRNFLTRKRGANMGKVAMKGFDILSKQYKNRTVSRNEVKEANKADMRGMTRYHLTLVGATSKAMGAICEVCRGQTWSKRLEKD